MKYCWLQVSQLQVKFDWVLFWGTLYLSAISLCFQIELLWRRSLADHDGRLFCLVNVDLLDYGVSQKASDVLEVLLHEPQYSQNEGNKKSLLSSCGSFTTKSLPKCTALCTHILSTIWRLIGGFVVRWELFFRTSPDKSVICFCKRIGNPWFCHLF